MDAKTRQDLEELNETCKTNGWEILSKSIEKKIEAIKEELTLPRIEVNEHLLRIAQGRILAYRDLLSLPLQTHYALVQDEEIGEDDPV